MNQDNPEQIARENPLWLLELALKIKEGEEDGRKRKLH